MGAPIDTTIVADEVGMPQLPHAHTGRAILPFSWIQAFGTGWGLSDGGGLYIHHTLSKNTLLHEHHDTATLGHGTCQQGCLLHLLIALEVEKGPEERRYFWDAREN